MKKPIKITLMTLLVVAILSIYPIYAIVIWNTSKSPDDFSKFPTSGVWTCENKGFKMTIVLTGDEANSNPINAKSITITFDNKTYELDCYKSGGHGTMLAPVAPSTILNFKTKDLNHDNSQENIGFFVSKFKFNENDFYFLDISVSKNNTLKSLTNKMDLHFVRL